MNVEVPDGALGLYHIIVTCKKVTQEADDDAGIEEEYEGVDEYKMDEVLNILKMEFLRGDVDPATGRGAPGPKEQVLHAIDGDVMESCPTPQVVIDNLDISNVHLDANERLVASVAISGHATFALSDIHASPRMMKMVSTRRSTTASSQKTAKTTEGGTSTIAATMAAFLA